MRVAVLSDVHGNVMALEAALADLGSVDMVVANGDLLSYGPRPAETLALLCTLPRIAFVAGNNDRYLVEHQWTRSPRDGWEAESFANMLWTAEAVGGQGLEMLASWPFSCRLPLQQDTLVVHASPESDNLGMFPWTPDEQLERMVSAVPEPIVVCGHTHLLMDRKVNGHRILSDGSAGFPFDRDGRPSYLILDDDSGEVRLEQHRFRYDVDAALEDLEQSQAPFSQVIAYQMRHAALMPKHETDYARRTIELLQ